MNLTIMGMQGSGKGTQAKRMTDALGLPHISTGDLFRKNMTEGTALGARAKAYIDKGELVPDSVVIDMVRDRLAQPDAEVGFILDGFPRSGVQMAALEYLRPVECAVMLELDQDTAVKRLGGRAECPKCGIIYGANRRPKAEGKCDECAGPLKVRGDDQDTQAIMRRLEVYAEETAPLIAYYEWKGVLHRIDGRADPDTVFANIMKAVKR